MVYKGERRTIDSLLFLFILWKRLPDDVALLSICADVEKM